MAECKIVDYSDNWRDGLKLYMRKTFVRYSDAYIEYCLDNASGFLPSKVIVNSKEEIVGCHLFYCTKALIDGEVINTQWGHDTFLDKEYRAEFGLDFMLFLNSIKGFGIGLTDVNTKIQKKLKSRFFQGAYNYYTINRLFFLMPIQKLFHQKPRFHKRETIKADGFLFRRVYDANEITIPNKGFWYEGFNDLDFVRDAEFINRRFINCNVFDYRVYASEDAYFVVRESKYRGYFALTLCDFRYNPRDGKSLRGILKAVKRLAIKSGYGIVFFVCGDKYVDNYYKRRLHYKTPLAFVASGLNKNTSISSFSLTGGDSDADFLKF